MKPFYNFLIIAIIITISLLLIVFPAIGYKPNQVVLFPIGIIVGIVSTILAQAVFD